MAPLQALTGGESKCNDSNHEFLVAHVALSVLPFWVRLMQCCRAFKDSGESRHCANALKYCMSTAVVMLSFISGRDGSYYAAWQLVSLASTMCAQRCSGVSK